MKLKDILKEDRYGHPITAQGNQTFIQLNKLIKMYSNITRLKKTHLSKCKC